MRRLDVKIPIYGWNITVITIFNKEDEQPVKELFSEFDLTDDNAIDNIVNERYNGGDTYVNSSTREGLILIYKFESINIFHNVFNHEKRHLIDRIGDTHFIKDEREAIAYLDGYFSEQVYSNLDKLI